MRFDHKTRFCSKILASERAANFEQLGISQASVDALEPLIPTSIDLKKNIDLIGVAFNAAVVNKFNRNGDGIDTDTALGVKDFFVNKPTNIEHKKQAVVGHIVSSAFSAFGSNELLTDKEAESLRRPFNIALAAVVYKTVNPGFAQLLENDEEEDDEVISASWELGFNDYYLALGSDNLDEAEIITDPGQIKEFSKYLKAYDGNGKTKDGVSVNRLIVGEIFPLGIAFTTNPAADVEGVYVEDPEADLVEATVDTKKEEIEEDCIPPLNKFNNKISHCEEINVNPTNESILMDRDIIKQFEDILSEKLDKKQFSEEALANVAQIIHEAILKKDQEYKAERDEREEAEAEAASESQRLQADLEELKEQLNASQAQLGELQEEKAVAEAKERFNLRMSAVDEEFELSDGDREIIATELQSLADPQEAFASYQDKLRIMWVHKAKSYIEASEKQITERIEKEVAQRLEELSQVDASEETPEVEDVLDNVEAPDESVVTNNNAEGAQTEPSLRDKFQEAFSRENLTIKL